MQLLLPLSNPLSLFTNRCSVSTTRASLLASAKVSNEAVVVFLQATKTLCEATEVVIHLTWQLHADVEVGAARHGEALRVA